MSGHVMAKNDKRAMSKKALAAALRELGVINGHDLLLSGEPIIQYQAGDTGRFASCGRWVLWVKNRKIKNRPWYEHGAIHFISRRQDRAEQLEQAKAKAKEMFPNIELVPGPWRMSWVPKAAMERAMALIANGKKKS